MASARRFRQAHQSCISLWRVWIPSAALPYVLQGTIRVSERFSHGSAGNALELVARLSQPFERHKKSDCVAAHAARGGEQIVAVMEQCPYLTSHRHQRLRLAG